MTDAAPILGRRERKKRAMRANILATATRFFSENGYHETTIGQIADELDISSATFFNYFGSKDAIVEELANEIIEEVEKLLQTIALSPADAVSLVEAHFAGSSLHPKRSLSRGLSVEILRIVLTSPDSPKVLERLERSIAKILGESQRLGLTREDFTPEQVARATMHLSLGAVTAWLMAPKDRLERRIAESLTFVLGTIETAKEAEPPRRRGRRR